MNTTHNIMSTLDTNTVRFALLDSMRDLRKARRDGNSADIEAATAANRAAYAEWTRRGYTLSDAEQDEE